MLPTPNHTDALLPTPTAHDDGKSPEAHWAMKERMGGGRTVITSLSVLARADLLPTPQARDGDPNGRGASHPDRRKELCAKRGGQLDEVATHLPTPNATHGRPSSRTGPLLDGIVDLLPTPRATDAAKGGPNQRGSSGDLMLPSAAQPSRWGRYAAAVVRWETVTGNPVPDPTIPGTRGQPTLNPRLSEWMMGLPPGWLDVPGVSASAQKAAAGNGVVPQQAAMALRMLLGLATA